jgi:hypothetical protein
MRHLSGAWLSAFAATNDTFSPLTVYARTVHTCFIVVPCTNAGGPQLGDEPRVMFGGLIVAAGRLVLVTHRLFGRSWSNSAETMQNMPLEEYMLQTTAEPSPSKRSRATEKGERERETSVSSERRECTLD